MSSEIKHIFKTMDVSEWTMREGEGNSYVGLIGAGGYGEIHEVIVFMRFSLLLTVFDRQRSQVWGSCFVATDIE